MRRLLFIANASAGSSDREAQEAALAVLREGGDVEVVETETHTDAVAKAEALESKGVRVGRTPTQVADALAERIHAGTLAPGSQLPTEAELCAEFDVSRTVVREAVARLPNRPPLLHAENSPAVERGGVAVVDVHVEPGYAPAMTAVMSRQSE